MDISRLNPERLSDNEVLHYAKLVYDPWVDRLLEIIEKQQAFIEDVENIDNIDDNLTLDLDLE